MRSIARTSENISVPAYLVRTWAAGSAPSSAARPPNRYRLGLRPGVRYLGLPLWMPIPGGVMSTYSAPRGPAPKPASQRRRRTKPKSYGAAEPTVAGQGDEQPPLGFEAHVLVVDLRAALGSSVEGPFYSAADWQR